MTTFSKWVSCWGNATSITDRKESTYARDLTLRYPIRMCFSGSKVRLRFSNLAGTEPVTLTSVAVSLLRNNECVPTNSRHLSFAGEAEGVIPPGEEILSDELPLSITAGDSLVVSIYLGEFTQMNAGTLITGPLSKGQYAYGNFADEATLPRWKSLEQIAIAGHWAAEQVGGVEFWDRNWRKGGLQQRRSELLREHQFYNQRYCGCEFSMAILDKHLAQ